MIQYGKISSIEWILRIGVFGTFLGHGLLALFINAKWIPYLVTIGVTVEEARIIMPLIGAVDIVVAVWTIIKPNRNVVLWAFIWALATALIRPISGEVFLEFVERTTNWAVPLALYLYKFK